MAQWHSSTVAQRHSGTVARWHSGTVAQRHRLLQPSATLRPRGPEHSERKRSVHSDTGRVCTQDKQGVRAGQSGCARRTNRVCTQDKKGVHACTCAGGAGSTPWPCWQPCPRGANPTAGAVQGTHPAGAYEGLCGPLARGWLPAFVHKEVEQPRQQQTKALTHTHTHSGAHA